MKLNTQTPHKPILDHRFLYVKELFYSIQGEGVFIGTPAWFIRLGYCNLQCPHCDTDYSTQLTPYDVGELCNQTIRECQNYRCNLVVVTGGEPFLQWASVQLLNELVELGLTVQVETNGVYFPVQTDAQLSEKVVLVCSPKTAHIHPRVCSYLYRNALSCLKYVISAGFVSEKDGLPTSSLGCSPSVYRPTLDYPRRQIYLMPEDPVHITDPELYKKTYEDNLHAAAQSCLQFGYRLTLQLHKYCKLP